MTDAYARFSSQAQTFYYLVQGVLLIYNKVTWVIQKSITLLH